MQLLPLLLSLASAGILVAGFLRMWPYFYSNGGLFIVLALSIAAIVTSLKSDSKLTIIARSISSVVILALTIILIKSYYLHNKVELTAREHSNGMQRHIEELRLEHAKKTNASRSTPESVPSR